ncbi:MAG: DUF3833 domain-containing protein [Pseudomonadota bacterium]
MKFIKAGFAAVALMILSACTGPSLKEYDETTPELKFEDYFNGPIKAWGVVQDWRGNVTRRFDIDLVGSWDGNSGTLEEDFDYYDGEKDQRVWHIQKLADGHYEGKADDINGTAKGQAKGHAVRWKYVMDLDVDGKTYAITFDDWMFLMNDGVLINRSYLKKFGIKVAELTIFMQKQSKGKAEK